MKILSPELDEDRSWLKDLRVLYVEDEDGIRQQLEQFLLRRVREVIAASNGREGLELFKEHHPDIVITDLLMPVMNGLDMIESILAVSPRTPIIITTAFNETHYLLKAIELGVDAYVVKPIATNRLVGELLKCARNLSFETAYRKGNRLLRLILSSLNEAVLIVNAETKDINYCNRTAETLFGYPQHLLIGMNVGGLYSDRKHFEQFCEDALAACQAKGSFEAQARMLKKNGETFLVEHSVRHFEDISAESPLHLICLIRDITLQKRTESILLEHQAQLDYLAHHDPLTGLSNRRLFQDRLEHALARARRANGFLALLFLDLDGFKPVNDRYGHELGDEVLRAAAQRLSLNVREQDTLGRFGGDEFVLLVEDIEPPQIARQIAEKLIETLASPFEIKGHCLNVGVSIGISLYPAEGEIEDANSLIHHADQAMYRAKQQGGGCYAVFSD